MNQELMVILFITMNVLLTASIVSGWVMLILWKFGVKEILIDLEEAIQVKQDIEKRVFEEK